MWDSKSSTIVAIPIQQVHAECLSTGPQVPAEPLDVLIPLINAHRRPPAPATSLAPALHSTPLFQEDEEFYVILSSPVPWPR